MNGIEVSILVVGFNSVGLLPDCLSSIERAIEGIEAEILFINNGTDQSEDLIARDFPLVRIFKSRGNVGFAAANNTLARHARGQWLLLLNPDIQLQPDAISKLLRSANHSPDTVILGGVAIGDDGMIDRRTVAQLPRISSLLMGMIGAASLERALDETADTIPVQAICGGFMMVRKEAWQALEGMDEDFFLYAEELDLCKRAGDAGAGLAIVPASRMVHDVGSGQSFSAARLKYQVTGNAHYAWKHFGTLKAAVYVLVLWAACVVRFGVGGLLGLAIPRFASMSKGFAPLALRPWLWIRGYASPSADPRRLAS